MTDRAALRSRFAAVRRAVPLTPVGFGITTLGLLAYVAGWQLGWIELGVVAAACLVALTIAVPFVLGRSRVDLERTLARDRVEVGDLVDVVLTSTNRARRPSRRVEVNESIGGRRRAFLVPRLAPQASYETRYELRPVRRARLELGPASIARSDPLGLFRREVSESDVDVCWVHPVTRLVDPPPVGFAKDLEGPTSDTSPAGDVAFHTIRQYATGDDRRHIHWRSTAKTGTLMVRHFVDNRRPHLAVHLDTAPDAFDDESFETAVSVAASLVSSLTLRQLPVSLRIGDRTVIGDLAPGDRVRALEALTVCAPEPADGEALTANAAGFVRREVLASSYVLVTGSRPADELLRVVGVVRRHVRPLVLTVGDPDRIVHVLPGARVLAVEDLDTFAAAWNLAVS